MDESGDADAPSRAAQLGVYVQIAFLGGAALLVVALLALAVRFAVAEGEFRWLALFALLLLIGGPFSLLYLLPVAADPEARAELTEGMSGYERPGAGKSALAAALGAAALLAAFAAGPPGLVALLALVFAVSLTVSLLDADWSFDPGERTLTYQDLTADLDAVTGSRRIDVGERAILWLAYAGPNDLDERPRLLVLPATVADEVLAAVPEEPPEEASRPADERVAIAVTGLLFLGTAAGLVVLGRQSASADSFALVAFAGMPALLGVLLLYLAR